MTVIRFVAASTAMVSSDPISSGAISSSTSLVSTSE
jgi:hypothetical protein